MTQSNIRGQLIQRWVLPLLSTPLLLLLLAAGTGALRAAPLPQQSGSGAQAAASAQPTFATPEEGLQALVTVAKTDDPRAVSKLFGPDGEQLQRFAENLEASAQLQKDGAGYTILVGETHWPFPIPLVSRDGRWLFDTKAGLQEILDRRIGEDELAAMSTCRAYAVAQWEYYTESGGDTQGLAVYAQKFVSSPGRHNGLYWETAEDEKPSPLGALVAEARAEGYGPRHAGARPRVQPRRPRPFHGYHFKILTAQGPSAPGGKFSYIINGNMIAGYALVAYPAKWGDSGVMTFIINQQGRVYQKNLGPDTAKIASEMTEYNPDPSWQLAAQ